MSCQNRPAFVNAYFIGPFLGCMEAVSGTRCLCDEPGARVFFLFFFAR